MILHGLRHHSIRTDARITADCDVAEHFRTRTDNHPITDGGVALHRLQRGTAERDTLVDRDVVTHNCGFTDHHTTAVVDEDAAADLRTRMDFDLRPVPGDLRQIAGEEVELPLVQRMRDAMCPQGVESRVQQHHLECAACSRIAIQDAAHIVANVLEQGLLHLVGQACKQSG